MFIIIGSCTYDMHIIYRQSVIIEVYGPLEVGLPTDLLHVHYSYSAF